MSLTADPTILIPVDVSITEPPDQMILDILKPVNIVMLGYYPVPKQTVSMPCISGPTTRQPQQSDWNGSHPDSLAETTKSLMCSCSRKTVRRRSTGSQINTTVTRVSSPVRLTRSTRFWFRDGST
jgi:hypothetical protein